jgi:hypothetical protein
MNLEFMGSFDLMKEQVFYNNKFSNVMSFNIM